MFGQYWWCGIFVFLLYAALNFCIFKLRDKPELSYKIAYGSALFLLVYKIVEYICWQAAGFHMKFPAEFSALSYFLFGITVVFRLRKLDSFATFCGFLAGTFYSVGFWLSAGTFIRSGLEESVFLMIMAIVNHHVLYFGCMLMIANVRRFDPKKFYVILIGVCLMVGYSWIIHLFTPYADANGKLIFIRITEGTVLNFLFPNLILKAWIRAVYYVVAIALFGSLLVGFYTLNGRLAKRRAQKLGYVKDFPDKISFPFRRK